jgi:filamentous hemagglutinin
VSLALLATGFSAGGAAHGFVITPPAASAVVYTYDYPVANTTRQAQADGSVAIRGHGSAGSAVLPMPSLRARLAAKGGLTWAEQSGILRAAARGKGNFGVGSATAREADDLGRAWVGEGYTVASDGKTLVSESGLRQYRPPSYKPKRGSYQANFEQRFEGQRSNRWQGNAHLDITDLP